MKVDVLNVSTVFYDQGSEPCGLNYHSGGDRALDYYSLVRRVPISRGAGNSNRNDCFILPEPGTPFSVLSYNSLVVGAADICTSNIPAQWRVAKFTSYQNGIGGLEMPHIVSPGESSANCALAVENKSNLATAGDSVDQYLGFSGTSAATPIVSGMFADAISHSHFRFKKRPEVLYAAALASADEDVDGFWLDLNNDAQDYQDGVGMINAANYIDILDRNRNSDAGNDSISTGYYYGLFARKKQVRYENGKLVVAATVSVALNVTVPANSRFVAALFMAAQPLCTADPINVAGDCTGVSLPQAIFYLSDSVNLPLLYSSSMRADHNWQYVIYDNPTNASIQAKLTAATNTWPAGIGSLPYSIAWRSR
jgi:hypothetical protein